MMRPETWLALVGAMGVGGLTGVLSLTRGLESPSGTDIIRNCAVTDGDTIRCGSERIRLLGIDAPELPGHCRSGRVCVPGDPFASTSSLERAMSATMRIWRVGEDRYGRTLGLVTGDRGDLSCWQLAHKQAAYKLAWDNGMRLARACRNAIF